MKHMLIRTVNLLLVAGILLVYDTLVYVHAQQDDLARLNARLSGSEQTVEQVRTDVAELERTIREQKKRTAAKTPEEDTTAEPVIGAERSGEDKIEESEEISDSGLIDGEYQGEAQGFGGPISVSVHVEDGVITDVEILSAEGEDPAYLETGCAVIGSILEAQSADVDTVSGATFSSAGIRDAAAMALEMAGN